LAKGCAHDFDFWRNMTREYSEEFLGNLDIEVDAMRWKWVRLDPATLSGVELAGLVLKEPGLIYDTLAQSAAPAALSAIVEDAV